ncbi:MAG: hypothetical protein LUG55_08085 [Clostridiales bacterium]|nr:hypothetical protein [Clostridiales bacterium]
METLTFKQAMMNDVTNVFFNPGEFADTHTIDGVEMTAMVDDVEHIEREKKMKSSMDGIYARQILLYVKASEFGPLPAQGRVLKLDGKTYSVVDTTDECGVYTITLEANRSR